MPRPAPQRSLHETGRRHGHARRKTQTARPRLLMVLACVGAGSVGEVPARAEETIIGTADRSRRIIAQAASPEVTFWESVRDSTDPAEIESYLKAYPNGEFAALARIRINRLKAAAPASPPENATKDATAEEKPVAAAQGGAGSARQFDLTARLGEYPGSGYAVLGVRIADLTDGLVQALGLASPDGILVTDFTPFGAAQSAGVKVGDVIVSFDGHKVMKPLDLQRYVSAFVPGAEVHFTVRRGTDDFNKVVDRLRERAESGDAEAAYTFGLLNAFGAGVPKNDTEAARWYVRAAGKDHVAGMYQLGVALTNGYGTPKDQTEGISLLRRSADLGSADAALSVGSAYLNGIGVTQNAAEALTWFRKAAEKGNGSAANEIGRIYANGNGVAKDDAEAIVWFRNAADADNADAITNLGVMYEGGRGVFKDEARALEYYRQAAGRWNTRAMVQIANMYLNGRGVQKDASQAVSWYRKAASLSDSGAIAMLGWAYANGYGVAKDQAEAVSWYRKAADAGHADAMNKLGYMYANGLGTGKSATEAFGWYQKSAEKGLSDGMYSLATAYETGLGTQKDPSAAAEWIFKALKAKNAFAAKEMTTNSNAWSREFRRELQRRMRDNGAYDGPIDGDFGSGTQAAIEALAAP